MSGHIPWNKIDLWLQEYRTIWLSTTRPDTRPHCVPVWFWWENSKSDVYISIHRDSVKAGNLAYQPAVILNAGNGDDTIILEGIAHSVMDEEEMTRINESWQSKYVDPYSGARASLTDGTVYRIEVHHIMAWEYGSVNTRTDWHFKRA